MKKSICMLLASVLLVFALTACQGSEKSSTFETLNGYIGRRKNFEHGNEPGRGSCSHGGRTQQNRGK